MNGVTPLGLVVIGGFTALSLALVLVLMAGSAGSPGVTSVVATSVATSDEAVGPATTAAATTAPTIAATSTTSAAQRPSPSPAVGVPVQRPPSSARHLKQVARITGGLSPKSVVAGPDGLVVANNMIYTHTVNVYDADHQRVAVISDAITPSDFGYGEWTSVLRGGPVEGAFSPDGTHYWVSNYSMYGPGFRRPGDDTCSPSSGYDRSFLYRVNTSTWKIDDVVLVGQVPKYVAVTPDGRFVLVTGWCSWDLTIVDASTRQVVATVPIGRYPRGIAVTPDSRTAYVAVMGSANVAQVDLERVRTGSTERGRRAAVTLVRGVGAGPRQLNISPDGRYLYVTLNAAGAVAKLDTRTGEVIKRVRTGVQPRSSVLSPDGSVLFVVNYESGTVSRIRTRDLKVVESVKVDHHPIGITYAAATDELWVCSYVGVINVFSDATK